MLVLRSLRASLSFPKKSPCNLQPSHRNGRSMSELDRPWDASMPVQDQAFDVSKNKIKNFNI